MGMSGTEHKFFEEHKNELGQVGEIITVFNRIENMVVLFLTDMFTSLYDNHERMLFMNDSLNDISIFETFNQKMNFLEKAITRVAMIATKSELAFEEKKYLAVCKSIRGIQKYRNKIAHMSLAISAEGKAVIFKRKADKELLVTKTGSFNKEELDLEEIRKKVWAVHNETQETLIKEGSIHVLNILLREELAMFDRTKRPPSDGVK